MTPAEFYAQIAERQGATRITFKPGVELVVGPSDIMAARLIKWLHEQLPPETPYGDLDDILDAAKWWTTFWHAAYLADTEKPE